MIKAGFAEIDSVVELVGRLRFLKIWSKTG